MTILSKKTDYALLILSYLHSRSEAGAQTIADHYNLPKPFLANILKELRQKGFVISQRGVKGGYSLARPVNEITVGEIIEALEDGFQLASCVDHDTEHDHDLVQIPEFVPMGDSEMNEFDDTPELREPRDGRIELQALPIINGNGKDDACKVMSRCPIRSPIQEIHRRIMEVLRAVTLAELFNNELNLSPLSEPLEVR
jgi:Rrf2 family protein